ncbi:MAG: hypothetical protein C4326_14440 [Ignavibacteria bacterium]
MKSLWSRLAVLFLFAATSFNCFKEPLSPVLPTWDVNATFPLGARVYTLGDLVAKDTSLLKTGGSNQIIFAKSVALASMTVNDRISLTPKDTSVAMKLGAFSITAPPKRSAIIIPWLVPGQTMPIPDTTMVFADIISKIDAFQEVTLKSGTISLQLDNNLPVAMEITTPILLFDQYDNVIATFTFSPPTIPPFSSRTASDNLASKSFTSDYRISGLQFHTPGSNGTPVQIPNGDLLVATLSTANLKARQAVMAEIPAQRLVDNDTTRIRIDDSTLVKEVYMKSGALRLSLQNQIALSIMFLFRFDELERRVGNSFIPYEDSVFLPAYGSGSIVLDIARTRVASRSGDLLRVLNIRGSVWVASTVGQPVTVSETDRVSIAMTTASPFVADSAVGVVKPVWVSVDSKVNLGLWKGLQKFSGQLILPAAHLRLATNSSIGFPSDAFITLGARKASGDSVFVTVPASQRRLMPGQNAIDFDPVEVGRFFSQLSPRLPDSVRVYGRILINPPDVYNPTLGGVGSVGAKSGVSGTVNVSVPLTLGLQSGIVRDTLVIGDTLNNGRKGFMIDQATLDQYNRGKVFIELENGVPAELGVTVSFLGASRTHLMTLPQPGVPIRLAAAQVDGSGNVVASSRSTTVLELSRQELANYNTSEFLSYVVGLTTSSGSSAVQFRTDNQVKIRMWTQLMGRIR